MFLDKKQPVLFAWYLLYFTYGFLPIITGMDKYFDLIADWSIYLNPIIPHILKITPQNFMYFIGISEIIMGLIVFIIY